jgi:hypothetical protein
MARWPVSQPRGNWRLEVIALRHQLSVLHRQRPSRSPALRARSSTLDLAPPGLAAVLEHHGVGEAGDRSPVAPSRLPALLALALKILERPSVDREVRDLMRQMNSANPRGASRIHGELLRLGIKISQATVAKYMVRRSERLRRHGVAFCATKQSASSPSTCSSPCRPRFDCSTS